MLQKYIESFFHLFNAREDSFVYQRKSGEYRPKFRPFELKDVYPHLITKNSTYGVYVVKMDNTVNFCCFDIDIDKEPLQDAIQNEGAYGEIRLKKIAESEAKKQGQRLTDLGIPFAIENSGRRGYHIWIFFDKPIPAYYIVKFGEKIGIIRNKTISKQENWGKQYEFFPKQSFVERNDRGNAIKLPLSIHRVSRNPCLFLDPTTMQPLDQQFDYLVELDTHGRVKSDNLEKIVGEKIDFTIYDTDVLLTPDEKERKKRDYKGKTPYDINILDLDKFQPVLDEMIAIFKYPPRDDGENTIKNNINMLPPCMYKIYQDTLHKHSQYESRTIMVRFLANAKRKVMKYSSGSVSENGFTPDEIASFFYYHINDDEDNKHINILKTQVAYYYGDLGNPRRLESCESIQKKGYCINFDYKPIDLQLLLQLLDLKTRYNELSKEEQAKLNQYPIEILKFEQFHDLRKNSVKFKSQIKENKMDIERVQKDPDFDRAEIDVVIRELEKNTQSLEKQLDEQIDNIKSNFQIICERIWHPLSSNNEFEQDKEKNKIEDDEFEFQQSNKNEKDEIDESEIIDVPENKLNIVLDENKLEMNKKDKINEGNLLIDKQKLKDILDLEDYANEENIDMLDKDDGKTYIDQRPTQCSVSDDFAEVNNFLNNMYDSIIKEPERKIHEIHKTTRVGVTTSSLLNAVMKGLRVILLAPTTNICRDTFSKTVKISEDLVHKNKLDKPIFGAVLGKNNTICLKLYEEIYVDLVEKFNKKPEELAVLKDLPFLFKRPCVRKSKGNELFCPYWNCIHVGYPKDLSGGFTPVIDSYIPKTKKESWCNKYHHAVIPDEVCRHNNIENDGNDVEELDEENEKVVCNECPHFIKEYQRMENNSRPICSYATIYRHMIGDFINIQIEDSVTLDTDLLLSNESERLVYLTRTEVEGLINDGFIPKSQDYCDLDGNLRKDTNFIQNIQLRHFDVLALTYTKVRALYQSLENIKKVGKKGGDIVYTKSEGILESMKNTFNGIICDEVSHLVAQSPVNFPIYNIHRDISDIANGELKDKETSHLERIELSINDLNRKKPNDDIIILFTTLYRLFLDFFKDIHYWMLSPNDLTEIIDTQKRNRREIKQQLVVEGKIKEKEAFEQRMKEQEDKEESDYEKEVKFNTLMNDIIENNIPDGLIKHVQFLQNINKLDGKSQELDPYTDEVKIIYHRNKIRYINVFDTRIRMQKIRKAYKKFRDGIDEDNPENIIDIKFGEELESVKPMKMDNDKIIITSNDECQKYLEEYKDLKKSLIIQKNEIAIINEILFPFDDKINDLETGEDIGKFEGYERVKRNYICIGWTKLNVRLLYFMLLEDNRINIGKQNSEHIKRKIEDLEMRSDEYFFKMYSFLTHLAFDHNIGFSDLVNMLLLSNSNSFFINAFSTIELKTSIVLQSVPSFDNIVNLVRGINCNVIDENIHNFAIATDATMPLIDMSTVFGFPTQIWKVGDPKNTCNKQLVISDSKKISITELLAKPPYIKNVTNEKMFENNNVYHVVKRNENNEPIQVVDITKLLIRFRLFVFINTLAEKYGSNNLFIISPNKNFDTLIERGMLMGLNVHEYIIGWLKENYPNEFQIYCEKKWLRENGTENNQYLFYLTKIGGKDNGDHQYYRGNLTIGTESKCRIMLAITPPSSPINSCDWLAYYYYEKNFIKNKNTQMGSLTTIELSKALRRVELQGSCFQTISRVKDPYAQTPSIVFAWGFLGDEYKWAKCERCNVNELELYKKVTSSYLDFRLNIKTDEIYATEYKKNGITVTKDLCYDCIKAVHGKPIGIASKSKEIITQDPNCVEDYLRFKIPLPKTTNIGTMRGKSNENRNHFLEAENRMLYIADEFVNNLEIVNGEILRIKDRLVILTKEIIKKKVIDITQLTSENIYNDLTFLINEIPYYITKNGKSRKVNWRVLEDVLIRYGEERLKKVNILLLRDNKYKKVLIRLLDFSEIKIE